MSKLTFASPSNVKTGFLCKDFLTPVRINKVTWPSVEHYLLGVRYPKIAEEIRRCPTVFSAKRVISKKNKLGQGQCKVTKKDIQLANKCKYSVPALRKKLVATSPLTLHDDTCSMSGPILMTLRADLLKPTTKKATLPDILFSGSISPAEQKSLETVLKIAHRIRKTEGYKQLYPEMFTDAVKLSVPDTDYVYYTSVCNSVKSLTLMDKYTKYPNLDKFSKSVESSFSEGTKSSVVDELTSLVLILRKNKNIKIKSLPTREKIKITPGNRKYRELPPDTIHRKKTKKLTVSEPKKEKETEQPTGSAKFITNSPVDRTKGSTQDNGNVNSNVGGPLLPERTPVDPNSETVTGISQTRSGNLPTTGPTIRGFSAMPVNGVKSSYPGTGPLPHP